MTLAESAKLIDALAAAGRSAHSDAIVSLISAQFLEKLATNVMFLPWNFYN